MQLASNAESTRDIRGAVQEIATGISGGTLTLSKSSYEYSGQRNTPDPTLVVGEDTLILGKDYTIEYTNNVNAGTATATAKGINGYTGTKTADFTITPKSIAVEWEGGDQFAYDGQEHIPTVKSPMDGVNGDKIYLKVTIKEGKQAIDAGTYTAVAEIERIEKGTESATPGDITVSHTITNKSNETIIGDSKVQKGTTLCIQITASQVNGTIKSIYSDKDLKSMTTATYNLEITENGTYGFAIVGSENTSKWYTVTVNNYVENQVPTGLQLGDYVSYTPSSNGTSAKWRVWEINEETGEVVITPTAPLGSVTLNGSSGWLSAETTIENECDKYINSSLGITADKVRSMKIEDIEKVMPVSEVTQAKNDYGYGQSHSYTSGTFYAEKANGSSGTFDGYNKALSSSKSSVTLVDTYWHKSSPTWNKLGNTKAGMISDTYGTILGNTWGWLASRCVYCDSSYARFDVRGVGGGGVGGNYLYYSAGVTTGFSYGVRPLVSLSSTLFAGDGQGTTSDPWKLAK